MKVTITLSEADAAAIWIINWGKKSGKTLTQMVTDTVTAEAREFAGGNFLSMPAVIAIFRAEQGDLVDQPKCSETDRDGHAPRNDDAAQTLLDLKPCNLIL